MAVIGVCTLIQIVCSMDETALLRLIGHWAYSPTSRLDINAAMCAFLHGGWLHLFGNMLFLFIAGYGVEDRWGHAVYLFFYLASAAAASLFYGAFHAESSIPLVGASGAVAAIMGAFLVVGFRAQITCFYWIIFRTGTFKARAYFVLPAWFAGQIAYALLLESRGASRVAYSAHIGGFLFGVVTALTLRWTGLERSIRAVFVDDDEVHSESLWGRADRLYRMGDWISATPLLERVIAEEPGHLEARLYLIEIALRREDNTSVHVHCEVALPKLVARGESPRALLLYERLEDTVGQLPLGPRALVSVATAAQTARHENLLKDATERLTKLHPDDPLTPGAVARYQRWTSTKPPPPNSVDVAP